MSGRRQVCELKEREAFDQVFLLTEKNLRANRNGNLYLQLRLADRTGSIDAMLWNASEELADRFQAGDYVQVEGATQLYNGALQVIATRVNSVDVHKVDERDFFPLGASDLDELRGRLAEMLRAIRNFPLRNLAESFLMDEAFMGKFTMAPAGIKHHHAYRGGLLEHVVDLMELADLVTARYQNVDADLVRMGVFLHDIGKIDELTYQRQMGYTDEGQLVGHIVMGVSILDEKVRETEKLSGEPFPRELAAQLRHLILSHHGEYEFGSPKLPMTLEAIVLHALDDMDAQLGSFQRLIDEDVSTDHWTVYHAQIGRKIYKGPSKRQTPEGA